MTNEIKIYLTNELNVPEELAESMLVKLERHADILAEFSQWLKRRDYDEVSNIEVLGYTAKRIHEMNPKFTGIGVYNFLITLRENPEFAEKCIREGFRVR